ncbi:MAG: polyphosphate kinase [Gammaproteobacteria bacterium]|nr:polyphosphate kinase [Gammaproteobacteria bacterium]
MFETAELGRQVARKEYKEQVPRLRERLLEVQQELRRVKAPVVLVFAGVDGAGKGETINLLSGWMDPRWMVTHAYTEPSQEERERPPYWRYWRDLPAKGRIGIFLSAWYSQPVLDRVNERITTAELDERLDRVIAFEKALADDNALVVKFWMHLGKEAQKKRLKCLEKDPRQAWRVTESDWHHWRLYDNFVMAAERAIMRTSTGHAPWHIVEGYDSNYRSLTVANILLESISRHLRRVEAERETRRKALAAAPAAQDDRDPPQDGPPDAPNGAPSGSVPTADIPTILATLDMSQALGKKAYKTELDRYQGRLNQLQQQAWERGISTLGVFEGWDAAGKGGAIRRCTAALDARRYEVIPFAAPSDEERAHHYLWRFWRHLGRAGRVTFFDRSWYGRVLVERVEGFTHEEDWMRAYAEINDFEAQLVESGIVLVKFWLHITPEEQYARFKAREEVAYKRWKLTDEDWRNRERWADYELAVNDMVERTSTAPAPWTLVESNDKRFARIRVLTTLCASLEKALAE